ncbi:heavy metal translocating P-type ATPase [Rubrolithibacter danxiaensis]|uniref:heavy metal translocating P-type ATPase n=1 Tax=Rubrolithibacter danxiaensis TaxID=3390805 RepID=UPI003BF8AF52
MEKIKIDLDILLPDVPDERDQCVKRIIEKVGEQKGIEEVHVIPANPQTKAQLCFHYDPDRISIKQVRFIAEKQGAEISAQFQHLLIDVGGILEINQANVLENKLKRFPGIAEVSVSATGNTRIEYDQTLTGKDQIFGFIEEKGFKVNSIWHLAKHEHDETGEHNHDHHEHTHDHAEEGSGWKVYAPVAISFLMLIAGVLADSYIKPSFFNGWIRLVWYLLAYLPVGWPVAWRGIKYAVKGDVFTEFILMSIATVGAFCIGEYPEGVAVMLFYTIGELFQDAAVNRAKRSIKALLDIRPDKAAVLRNGSFIEVNPEKVETGETIQVKAGEKVPLDGEILSEGSTFNTAALTGESKPQTLIKGETALAGMINQGKVVELKVTKLFNDSSLARILTLVQEATTRKAKTEQFIRKFSRVYTPIVVMLALCIVVLPYFFTDDYSFREWLYRALIFLVISCPCALVISIPLGYFGGIGAASRNGILFKGSNFLDLILKVNTVILDKTGTLTKGVFKVQQVISLAYPEEEWLPLAAALESGSTHPVAQAIVEYGAGREKQLKVEIAEEISGHGIKGRIADKEILAGNLKLMDEMGITVNENIRQINDTIVLVAIDKKMAGYVTISDEIKEDSKTAIRSLHQKNIQTIMLSGDKQAVVDRVAGTIGIDRAYGDLLPENKVEKVEAVKKDVKRVVAFVGDGINDAPVLALSDIGVAMGGLGSDAAIETADVIIQTDQPSKIIQAINIGKATYRVVWQNILFAFGVKIIVMVLGAGGLATMWEAVFADVGVALLAILNAVRIQRMKF